MKLKLPIHPMLKDEIEKKNQLKKGHEKTTLVKLINQTHDPSHEVDITLKKAN